jgi:hypothetical protein
MQLASLSSGCNWHCWRLDDSVLDGLLAVRD